MNPDVGAFQGDLIVVAGSDPDLQPADPVVLALTQLVEDRWAVEEAGTIPGVAFGGVRANITAVIDGKRSSTEASA